MKKGFTLIELLAVIVILAIIALIATPIILGIINDTRVEARNRSAEAVSHAVETAYLMSTLKVEANGSEASFDNKDVISNTKVENERSRVAGDATHNPSITTNDGVTCTLTKDYVLTCKHDDEVISVQSISHPGQIYKPMYYAEYLQGIGKTLSIFAKQSLSRLYEFGATYYGADVDADNEILALYICFVRNNQEYCLKGADPSVYEVNIAIIKDAFKENAMCKTLSYGNDGSYFFCDDYEPSEGGASAYSTGQLQVWVGPDDAFNVSEDGYTYSGA